MTGMDFPAHNLLFCTHRGIVVVRAMPGLTELAMYSAKTISNCVQFAQLEGYLCVIFFL